LLLVANPPHHPQGDFGLAEGCLTSGEPRHTYAGIGLYTPQLFAGVAQPRFSLASVIRAALARGDAQGLYHAGAWLDVGRPATLARARERAARAASAP